MKRYLSIILTVLVFAGVLTGCAEQVSTPEQSMVSNTDTPIRTLETEENPAATFSKEDYQKLLALQFDDYWHMTISEFQNKVWEMTDTEEYRNLLERFFQDEALYQMKDSDETASFLFYVLEPLTAESWQTRAYSGAAASDFPAWEDNATLEYTYTLTILNADIMVKDYFDIGLGIRKDILQNILKNRTKEELRNKAFMQKELESYLDEVLPYLQTPEVRVAIEYAYFPLTAEDENPQSTGLDNDAEQRRSPNGTEEDYRTLLALKTPDYEELPLFDFNSSLLEWANENPEGMERVSEDIAWNDFQAALTDQELSFVTLTVFLSGMENGKAIQSSYAGQLISPHYDEELPQKTVIENGMTAWCSLYYRFSYSISDPERVTVGERDRQIGGMIAAVHTFWNDAKIERMLKMSESDIAQELEKLALLYSTEHITISTDKEQIHYEHMDERQGQERHVSCSMLR